ncbi:MAG: heavy-metal-associated domain-containing protein [Nitrosomonas sp.]|nr:heavy-metal-associated domain-containing protein [Nitrosomonas sp.]
MQTTTIKIEGMTCMGCVNSVKKVLEATSGVCRVTVSLDPPQATIQYDADVSNIDLLSETIEEAGFNVVS